MNDQSERPKRRKNKRSSILKVYDQDEMTVPIEEMTTTRTMRPKKRVSFCNRKSIKLISPSEGKKGKESENSPSKLDKTCRSLVNMDETCLSSLNLFENNGAPNDTNTLFIGSENSSEKENLPYVKPYCVSDSPSCNFKSMNGRNNLTSMEMTQLFDNEYLGDVPVPKDLSINDDVMQRKPTSNDNSSFDKTISDNFFIRQLNDQRGDQNLSESLESENTLNAGPFIHLLSKQNSSAENKSVAKTLNLFQDNTNVHNKTCNESSNMDIPELMNDTTMNKSKNVSHLSSSSHKMILRNSLGQLDISEESPEKEKSSNQDSSSDDNMMLSQTNESHSQINPIDDSLFGGEKFLQILKNSKELPPNNKVSHNSMEEENILQTSSTVSIKNKSINESAKNEESDTPSFISKMRSLSTNLCDKDKELVNGATEHNARKSLNLRDNNDTQSETNKQMSPTFPVLKVTPPRDQKLINSRNILDSLNKSLNGPATTTAEDTNLIHPVKNSPPSEGLVGNADTENPSPNANQNTFTVSPSKNQTLLISPTRMSTLMPQTSPRRSPRLMEKQAKRSNQLSLDSSSHQAKSSSKNSPHIRSKLSKTEIISPKKNKVSKNRRRTYTISSNVNTKANETFVVKESQSKSPTSEKPDEANDTQNITVEPFQTVSDTTAKDAKQIIFKENETILCSNGGKNWLDEDSEIIRPKCPIANSSVYPLNSLDESDNENSVQFTKQTEPKENLLQSKILHVASNNVGNSPQKVLHATLSKYITEPIKTLSCKEVKNGQTQNSILEKSSNENVSQNENETEVVSLSLSDVKTSQNQVELLENQPTMQYASTADAYLSESGSSNINNKENMSLISHARESENMNKTTLENQSISTKEKYPPKNEEQSSDVRVPESKRKLNHTEIVNTSMNARSPQKILKAMSKTIGAVPDSETYKIVQETSLDFNVSVNTRSRKSKKALKTDNGNVNQKKDTFTKDTFKIPKRIEIQDSVTKDSNNTENKQKTTSEVHSEVQLEDTMKKSLSDRKNKSGIEHLSQDLNKTVSDSTKSLTNEKVKRTPKTSENEEENQWEKSISSLDSLPGGATNDVHLLHESPKSAPANDFVLGSAVKKKTTMEAPSIRSFMKLPNAVGNSQNYTPLSEKETTSGEITLEPKESSSCVSSFDYSGNLSVTSSRIGKKRKKRRKLCMPSAKKQQKSRTSRTFNESVSQQMKDGIEKTLGQIPENVATYVFDYPKLQIKFTSYLFHYLQFTLDKNNVVKKMSLERRIRKEYICVGENHILLTFERVAQPVLDSCQCKSLDDIPELVNTLASRLESWKSTGILLYDLFEKHLGFVEWIENRCSVHFIFVEGVIGNFYFHIDYDVNDDIPALRYSLEHSKFHYIIDEVKDLFLKTYNKEENNIIECCDEIVNVFSKKPLDIHAVKRRESGVTLELKI